MVKQFEKDKVNMSTRLMRCSAVPQPAFHMCNFH